MPCARMFVLEYQQSRSDMQFDWLYAPGPLSAREQPRDVEDNHSAKNTGILIFTTRRNLKKKIGTSAPASKNLGWGKSDVRLN